MTEASISTSTSSSLPVVAVDADVSIQTSSTPWHNLKCRLFNARSVCNKLSELTVDIAINNSYITLITETWLRQEVSSSLLINVNDFIVFRKDRKSLGGGVCAIIKSSLDTRSVKIDGNTTR